VDWLTQLTANSQNSAGLLVIGAFPLPASEAKYKTGGRGTDLDYHDETSRPWAGIKVANHERWDLRAWRWDNRRKKRLLKKIEVTTWWGIERRETTITTKINATCGTEFHNNIIVLEGKRYI